MLEDDVDTKFYNHESIRYYVQESHGEVQDA